MAGQILIALKGNDRLEQFIPYVEKITQPGMKIVFLIRYPVVRRFERFWGFRIRGEFPEAATLAERKMFNKPSSEEEERRIAAHKVFLAQEALRKRGVEIVVDVYTGNLRRVVERYRGQGGVQLIMMRMGSALRLPSFLDGTVPFSSLFKRPSFSHMLLLDPGVS